MPVYVYACSDCGDFQLFRSIGERNDPAWCPSCEEPARRSISSPNLALMPAAGRRAHAMNERSRHEPRVSGGGHSCGSGCGCGTPVRKKQVRQTKLGQVQGQKPGARPWMLGH